MARKRIRAADGDDVDGQEDLFPELDPKKEKDKALYAQAKKLYNMREARKEVLTENKAKVDAQEAKVLELMHEKGIPAFRYKSMRLKVKPGDEHAEIKMKPEKDEKDEEAETEEAAAAE